MDDYTAARFADAYEQPYPEDHPLCEECGDPMEEGEDKHREHLLCNRCGTVCDCCAEKGFDEDITIMDDKSQGYTSDMNVCKYCIEALEPDEIVSLHGSPEGRRWFKWKTRGRVGSNNNNNNTQLKDRPNG